MIKSKTVVLSLWEDQFDPSSEKTYSTFNRPDLPHWQGARGNKDRIRNLAYAKEHCGGLFRVVMVTAKDPNVIPRSAHKLYPHPTKVMRLTKLDPHTGEFSAACVDSRQTRP